jgi:hypothetical protein
LSLRGAHLSRVHVLSPAAGALLETAPIATGGARLAVALPQPLARLRLEVISDASIAVTGARVDEQSAAVPPR